MHIYKVKDVLMGSCAGLAVFAASTPATAQAPAEQLDEIIVTAQKRTESLQEVPMAVSAFTGDDLSAYGVSGTQALQTVTPGLVFNRTGPGAQPYIRGVGTRLAGTGLEPSVAVYIDDRYEPISSAMMFELADVERVEVLKGPQGVLYGRNATAGAIRVISKGVGDETEAQLNVGAGNFDFYSVSGSVNLPLGERFGTRLTGMVRKRDAFTKNRIAAAPNVDNLDALALRGKFELRPTEDVTANLTLSYWKRDDSQGFDQIDLSPPGLNTGIARGGISGRNRKEVATILASGLDADQFASDFRLDVDLGGISLASITTYARYKGKTTIDADGTSARVFDSANSRSRSTNYSQELQLVSAEGEALEWLVGGYYFVGRTRTDNKLDLGSPLTFSTGDQRARTNAFALFGQATLNFGDRWEVTAGGRWSHERKIVQTRASQAVNGSTLAFVPFDERKSWGAFTPKLTIQHNFDNGMAYLTYARGFKSGGYNYPARNPAGVGAVLDPEILDMVELGVKGDFFDRRLRANAAAYFYDYKDLQVTRAATSGSGSVTAVTENAANARIYGLDANITWLPADRLNLTAGLNLSKSEYRDFLTTAKVFNAVATGTAVPGMRDVAFNATGHTLLRSPDWSGFFAVEYDLPLGNAGRMPINLSYSYKDDYLFDFIALPSSGRLRQKAYGLLNARVTWVSASERYRVAAWVENLADQVYFDDLVASGAGIRGSYGAPRTYGVEFSASF